jgi:hypothetical protein
MFADVQPPPSRRFSDVQPPPSRRFSDVQPPPSRRFSDVQERAKQASPLHPAPRVDATMALLCAYLRREKISPCVGRSGRPRRDESGANTGRAASFRHARCRGEACFALLCTSGDLRMGAGRPGIFVWVRVVRGFSYGCGSYGDLRWGAGRTEISVWVRVVRGFSYECGSYGDFRWGAGRTGIFVGVRVVRPKTPVVGGFSSGLKGVGAPPGA